MSYEDYVTEYLYPHGTLKVSIRWMRRQKHGPHSVTYFDLFLKEGTARIGEGAEFDIESDNFKNFFEDFTRNLVPNPQQLVPIPVPFFQAPRVVPFYPMY